MAFSTNNPWAQPYYRPPKRPGIHPVLIVGAILFPLVTAVAAGIWNTRHLASVQQGLAAAFSEEQQKHDTQVQAEKAQTEQEIFKERQAHVARLSNPAFSSGALARAAHEAEWARRMAHEPALAQSPVEKILLDMERLGKDPAISAQSALEQVARLAAPAGSRVEVDPVGNQFLVKVAFKMSALSKNETGAVTKHHTKEALFREVHDVSARVLQELFDYCGTRGIAKIQVSCNHALRQAAVPEGATTAERDLILRRGKLKMDKLYRVSLDQGRARAISDWRQAARSQIAGMMTIEYNGIKILDITGFGFETKDPDDTLKF